MVLFDENPVTLIRETTANFHTQSDLSSLSRITSSLSTLHSARQLRLNAHTQSLSSLSRRLNQLNRVHADDIASHDAASHAQRILALDTEKFRVAKQASELEIEEERLGGELRGLRSQLDGLEREGDEGNSGKSIARKNGGGVVDADDQTVLRLKVYRSLGIDAEQDPTTGEFNRAVVRNTAKGNAHVVNIDPKFSRYFYAGHFWNSL